MRICSICARAGSQGLPQKNKRLLHGKPLFAYTIEVAVASGLFDWIIVSSDDEDILAKAKDYGANQVVRRPDELASASAGKLPAIAHAVRAAEDQTGISFDIMVDLDVTSPLRLVEDVKAAVALLEGQDKATNVITGHAAHRSPYFNLVERAEDGRVILSKILDKPVVRRQDVPACFDMNASIYVWKRDYFFPMPKVFDDHSLIYEMPRERGFDIDSELDFEIVELLFKKREGIN